VLLVAYGQYRALKIWSFLRFGNPFIILGRVAMGSHAVAAHALEMRRPRSAAAPSAGPRDTALGISVAHHEMVYCYTSRLSVSRMILRFRLAHYDPNGRREADDC
jgi:hypothetical protein